MKIELRKISFNERMSEETHCFVADLYINGKKVGYVKNDGRGGCTDYHGDSKENNELIRQAEAYCKTLPKVRVEEMDFEYDMNLENYIDELLVKYLEEKDKKKLEKKMQKLFETALVIGVPNSDRYTYFKQKQPLSRFTKDSLQTFVDTVKARNCVNGIVILNTNLAELGVKI